MLRFRQFLGGAAMLLATSVPAHAQAPVPVTFRFDDPKATSVGLVGDFSKGTVLPMVRDAKGRWTKTLLLKPGRYIYRFRVNDDHWTIDQQNPNNQIVNGVQASILTVGGAKSPAPSAAQTPATPLPAAPGPAGPVKLGDVQLNPGEFTGLEIPLSNAAWDDAGRTPGPGGDKPVSHNTKPKTVKAAIAVPAGFDPTRSWPLLIVSSPYDTSCIEHLNLYYKPATENGWVTLAADGPAKPKNDSIAWRWAMLASTLEHLRMHWPVSKDWPVACGGFGDGARRSGFLGAILTKKGYDVIGIWFGGSSEDTTVWGMTLYGPDIARFTRVPIFLSSGSHDDKAKPDQVKGMMEYIKRKTFRNVRFETYDGGHDVSADQIKLGLKWFLDEAKK